MMLLKKLAKRYRFYHIHTVIHIFLPSGPPKVRICRSHVTMNIE